MGEVKPSSVKIESDKGKHYSLCHVPEHPKGPFIILSSYDKDNDDFIDTAITLLEITNGLPQGLSRLRLYQFLKECLKKRIQI